MTAPSSMSATRRKRPPQPSRRRHFATSWSSDGRFLLTENATNTGYDQWVLSVSDHKRYLMLGEPYNEWAGVFSPDMRWVAYVSLEGGGDAQVCVRPFNVSAQTGRPSFGEGKWQISRAQESTREGERFVMEVPVDQPAARPTINVVLNWPALLQR